MTTEQPQWFTSSYSSNGGSCVKVATNLVATHGVVPVGDTKHNEGPTLTVQARAWSAFVEMAKHSQV
ncbi:DUF397 domain-containing protein [Streptomyces achromogenes]|uniref:DUF397 domain-containing protein n=1 Tax=Streptomyces achromogenes TaxID=67255 RepID=UPI0004C55017|nr:DUF397 domain-containing protein [Streptomyces achromogenes]